MKDQSNDKFTVNKMTDGVSIALDHFTCTATERMFLDEIRQLYEWNDHLGFPHLQRKEITKYSNIYQQDFKKTNLKELLNADQL